MNNIFSADKILTNGKIITVDAQDSIVEAVAIKNGRFLATGTTDEIKDLASSKTDVLNLEGKTVTPGIIDSHTHPVLQASHLIAIDCRKPEVKEIADIKDKIKKKARELGPEKWIRLVNFNDTRLLENRHITRWELDEVSANNPVYIMADTGHQSIVNSRALELAGVTKDTENPPGGEIERNENGEPTGLLYEMAEHLVSKIMPEYTVEELKPGYRETLNQLSEWGITSTHDAFAYDLGIRTFQQILKEGVR
ncbi:MAG: amidohydrolase family protein, partial [Deltaproteobacteria bacterium]|nr:amidohydrolase family protein [Deltaproteobacteria bacterium]